MITSTYYSFFLKNSCTIHTVHNRNYRFVELSKFLYLFEPLRVSLENLRFPKFDALHVYFANSRVRKLEKCNRWLRSIQILMYETENFLFLLSNFFLILTLGFLYRVSNKDYKPTRAIHTFSCNLIGRRPQRRDWYNTIPSQLCLATK